MNRNTSQFQGHHIILSVDPTLRRAEKYLQLWVSGKQSIYAKGILQDAYQTCSIFTVGCCPEFDYKTCFLQKCKVPLLNETYFHYQLYQARRTFSRDRCSWSTQLRKLIVDHSPQARSLEPCSEASMLISYVAITSEKSEWNSCTVSRRKDIPIHSYSSLFFLPHCYSSLRTCALHTRRFVYQI